MMTPEQAIRENAITALLAAVEEVVHNNDWPTTAGHMVDDGVNCSCPILDLVNIIRTSGGTANG